MVVVLLLLPPTESVAQRVLFWKEHAASPAARRPKNVSSKVKVDPATPRDLPTELLRTGIGPPARSCFGNTLSEQLISLADQGVILNKDTGLPGRLPVGKQFV